MQHAAPNKGTTILYLFRPPKTDMLNPGKMVKFKDFSRHLSVFQVLFKANFIFKDFQDSPVYSSTFQAYANSAIMSSI